MEYGSYRDNGRENGNCYNGLSRGYRVYIIRNLGVLFWFIIRVIVGVILGLYMGYIGFVLRSERDNRQ